MHYQLRYQKLIGHYLLNVVDQGEWHHIIPKCLGGSNDSKNLVFLPYKAHFLCHWILTKIYPNNSKLKHAFAMMIVENKYHNRPFTAKQYELARSMRREAMKGIPRSEETKKKMRRPKSNTINYKNPKSEEHRKNIGKAHKGKRHNWHHKIVESVGYKNHQLERKNKTIERANFHRENFTKLLISRQEYYSLYPEISNITLKRYLRGL